MTIMYNITLFFLMILTVYSEEREAFEQEAIDNSLNKEVGDILGVAHNYLYDEGISQDPSVIFASGFEDGFAGWTSYDTKISEIVTSTDFSFSGDKVLKSVAIKGVNEGGDVILKFPLGHDKIHFRFYTKFDENTVIPHHFAKISAIKDGYWPNAGHKPPGNTAFWTGIEPTKEHTWYFYTYWHEMRSWQTYSGEPDPSRGDNPYYGNGFKVPGQTPFKKGEWICVEAMLKANTPGKYDGEQAFWINGVKIGHWKQGAPLGKWVSDKFKIGEEGAVSFEGFNWRTLNDVKINRVKLQWYVSDRVMQDATQDENIVYFDNVVVATDYIGPMYGKDGAILNPVKPIGKKKR